MNKRLTLSTLLSVLLLLCVSFSPVAAQEGLPTHYALQRPIPAGYNRTAAPGFPFGWHRRNQSPLHHGVDMINPRGTPVIAAADGLVYYAGDDLSRIFGEKPNFYGQLIILEHDIIAPEGAKVFTLYGHVDTIQVQSGQRVKAGDRIGTVGAKGIAIGSHLHFEVRLGNPDDYFAVRNPELWYTPLPGTGTLIGRILAPDGTPAGGVRYTMSTASGVFPGFTYADPNLRSDPAFNENLTMADLRAGCYVLRVRGDPGGAFGAFAKEVCLKAGATVFVDVQLKTP